MVEHRWERVRSIVGRALELDGAERREFVEEACAGDVALRAEVEGLMAHEPGERGLLDVEPATTQSGSVSSQRGKDLTGRRLGDFELIRILGQGGMAVVYFARDMNLDRGVAIKVLEAGPLTPDRHIERFHREARAVASLRHPAIVPVFADGESDGLHWFAMEFVPGHDLGHEIELQRAEDRTGERPLLPRPGSPERAPAIARVCADVADALQHAHDHGLVHRDVKPQNLLLDRDGHVQIADFGLVRDESLGALTRTGEIPGTPHYMSPEQAHLTRAPVSELTDVYSLGVVLYELFALRRPFDGRTSAEVLRKIERFEPPPLRRLAPRVPRPLATICAKAMSKDPADRYGQASAMAADLRAWLAGDPILARPPSWIARGRGFLRRQRIAITVGVVLLVGVLLGALWQIKQARDARRAALTITAQDDSGGEVEGHAWLRRIDPLTGETGSVEALGRLPIRGRAISAGFVRIVVDLGDLGRREHSRFLGEGVKESLSIFGGSLPIEPGGMVLIPGGDLKLHDGQPLSPLEGRRVKVASFRIDAAEVSNEEYRRFLDDTQRVPPKHWSRVEPELHAELPVVGVGWRDAQAYAEWAGKRLPSFLEWTWAARGAQGRIYPWEGAVRGEFRGNVSKDVDRGKTKEEGFTAYFEAAVGVRTHEDARTPEGLFHMFGNVWEWTESPKSIHDVGVVRASFDMRIVAGHAWDAGLRGDEGQTLATYAFEGVERSFSSPKVGFRCVVSVEP